MKALKTLAVSTIISMVSGQALAAFDYGVAEHFNAYMFGNFTATHGDTQGRLAVGQNLTLSHFGIVETEGNPYAEMLSHEGLQTALVVGGSAQLTNSTLYYGDALINGASSLTNSSFNRNIALNSGGHLESTLVRGTLTTPGNVTQSGGYVHQTITGNTPISQNFETAKTYFSGYSQELASSTVTGQVSRSETEKREDPFLLTLTGDGTSETQVFNISADDLANAYDISLVGIGDATAILINIEGTNIHFSSMGPHDGNGELINSDSIFQRLEYDLLFNFYEAETIDISNIAIYGSILGADADVYANEGRLTGKLIANNYISDANFQFDWCPNSTPPVPEPSTYAMMLIGLSMIGVIARKKMKIQ